MLRACELNKDCQRPTDSTFKLTSTLNMHETQIPELNARAKCSHRIKFHTLMPAHTRIYVYLAGNNISPDETFSFFMFEGA